MSKKILMVSHDAGGAEILGAYVKKNPHGDTFFCILGGPAEGIFRRRKLNSLIIGNDDVSWQEASAKIGAIDEILAGTSWSSDLELRFIAEAKGRAIKTIAYLDHWVNFRERFGYPREGWRARTPDELWAGDEYALAKARREFPGVPVHAVPNLYFQEIQQSYNEFFRAHHEMARDESIVLMSEPLSEAVNIFGDKENRAHNEYEVTEELLAFFAARREKRPLVIRFHPSENHKKYDMIIARHATKLRIEKSGRTEDIFSDIARAAVVIGVESMALVVAYLCGKRAVSFSPDPSAPCPLPFPEIVKIKTVGELAPFL